MTAGAARATLLVAAAVALVTASLSAQAGGTGAPARYGIGRAATPDDIRKIDIDAMPDGRGLPPGRGTVSQGAAVYKAKCASCHGANGEGGSAERLVGRNEGDSFDFANNEKLVRTIGSYWPYATTVFDYTARSMPFMQPGTLTPDETYAVVAFLLFQNALIPETAVMDRETLPKVSMPARDRFVMDDRKGGKQVK
jgi:cytochrome c